MDEPAIREGLPLRKADWDNYLRWAVDSFRLSTSGVENDIQVHSHFCYSDFGDIFPSIQGLDADGEPRRSILLGDPDCTSHFHRGFQGGSQDPRHFQVAQLFQRDRSRCLRHSFTRERFPTLAQWKTNVWQRVPSEQEIKDRIAAMAKVLPADLMSKPFATYVSLY